MSQVEIPKPNNSDKAILVRSKNQKQSLKKAEPTGKTIKGRAVKKELTFGEKLKRSFVKEDIKDVGDFVIFDVLIPGIKRSVFDMIVGSISQMLGVPYNYDDIRRRSTGYSSLSSRTGDDRRYRDYTMARGRRDESRNRDKLRYDRFRVTDVVFEYKEDAESLLEQMIDICDTYNWFSVFDFYDKAGIVEGNDYTNNDYGWHSVDGASIRFDGTGYVIVLPQARMK